MPRFDCRFSVLVKARIDSCHDPESLLHDHCYCWYFRLSNTDLHQHRNHHTIRQTIHSNLPERYMLPYLVLFLSLSNCYSPSSCLYTYLCLSPYCLCLCLFLSGLVEPHPLGCSSDILWRSALVPRISSTFSHHLNLFLFLLPVLLRLFVPPIRGLLRCPSAPIFLLLSSPVLAR